MSGDAGKLYILCTSNSTTFNFSDLQANECMLGLGTTLGGFAWNFSKSQFAIPIHLQSNYSLFGLNFVSFLPLWEGERTPKDAEFIQSHILKDISSLNY